MLTRSVGPSRIEIFAHFLDKSCGLPGVPLHLGLGGGRVLAGFKRRQHVRQHCRIERCDTQHRRDGRSPQALDIATRLTDGGDRVRNCALDRRNPGIHPCFDGFQFCIEFFSGRAVHRWMISPSAGGRRRRRWHGAACNATRLCAHLRQLREAGGRAGAPGLRVRQRAHGGYAGRPSPGPRTRLACWSEIRGAVGGGYCGLPLTVRHSSAEKRKKARAGRAIVLLGADRRTRRRR